jgi:23S rRNA-/tRNA-specific pseudouridylate synthase
MPSARPDNRFYIVPESLDDERLDVCVSALDKSISRARVQRYIKDTGETDGVVCSSAKTLVRRGMRIDWRSSARGAEFAEAETSRWKSSRGPLMIVIDKPAGMVVHPAAGTGPDRVNALLGGSRSWPRTSRTNA